VGQNPRNRIKSIKEEMDTSRSVYRHDQSIHIGLRPNEDLMAIVAAGPYIQNGSLAANSLDLLCDLAKAKNCHLLILVLLFDAIGLFFN